MAERKCRHCGQRITSLPGVDWNGQKVWTSGAMTADYGMLIARTDWDAPKHGGISFFFLPMKQTGVEVRPLRQVTDESHFNEVLSPTPSAPSTTASVPTSVVCNSLLLLPVQRLSLALLRSVSSRRLSSRVLVRVVTLTSTRHTLRLRQFLPLPLRLRGSALPRRLTSPASCCRRKPSFA